MGEQGRGASCGPGLGSSKSRASACWLLCGRAGALHLYECSKNDELS